jgi:diguanylate cyclase (GGDEF)-like protein
MFDVDHFKRINDTYGHDVGDRVLRAIGAEVVNHDGVVGRLGGEEFAILLGRDSLEAAAEQAEMLRLRVAELSFDASGGKLSVTCSLGVALGRPGESIDALLKRADAALYHAKQSGRDRVAVACDDADPAGNGWSGLVRSSRRSAADDPAQLQSATGAPRAA